MPYLGSIQTRNYGATRGLNPPPGRLGRKVRFSIQFVCVLFGGLKIDFLEALMRNPCSISMTIKFRKTSKKYSDNKISNSHFKIFRK